MLASNPVLTRMDHLLITWEANQDRRRYFLQCYRMMTANILGAVADGFFEDNAWVERLMENFAGYYFHALEVYEAQNPGLPNPWQAAFKATRDRRSQVLQLLVLGMNAHINFDLVFALQDLLAPEWHTLNFEARQSRYRDHDRVNEIIHQTIDAVQDQIVEPSEPVFAVVDVLMGPVDEWMTSRFISHWREEVWEYVVGLLDAQQAEQRNAILARVEQVAMQRALDILGLGNFGDLLEIV